MRLSTGLLSLILLVCYSSIVQSKKIQKMLINKGILSSLDNSRDDNADIELVASGVGDFMTSKRSRVSGKELFGVPRSLFPLYASFILDSISVGLVMPVSYYIY